MCLTCDARQPAYLVQSDNKGSFPGFEEIDRLNSLWLKTVHDVYYQNSHVTQGGAAGTEIAVKDRKRIIFKHSWRLVDLAIKVNGIQGQWK